MCWGQLAQVQNESEWGSKGIEVTLKKKNNSRVSSLAVVLDNALLMSGVRGECADWLVETMASEGISNSDKHRFQRRYVEEHQQSSNYCIRITTSFLFAFWGHSARNNGTDRFCDSDHVSSLILKGSQYLIFQDHNLILQFFCELWIWSLILLGKRKVYLKKQPDWYMSGQSTGHLLSCPPLAFLMRNFLHWFQINAFSAIPTWSCCHVFSIQRAQMYC